MRAFKILLKILDVFLFLNEKDQGLIEVFNHSIEFSLFEKNNDPKFQEKFHLNNYSLQDLIKEYKIQKDVANEIYGEWIKQIQETNRNFVEDKLLNVKNHQDFLFLKFLKIISIFLNSGSNFQRKSKDGLI